MSNNAPDYENLAFKPKMTWEELVEFAKDYGFSSDESCLFLEHLDVIYFFSNGTIYIDVEVSRNRTYEQIKAIIENMFDKVEK